jgi:hypothetical protein
MTADMQGEFAASGWFSVVKATGQGECYLRRGGGRFGERGHGAMVTVSATLILLLAGSCRSESMASNRARARTGGLN